MKEAYVKIKTVQLGSIAEEAGIESGDILLSINNEKINDIFDYRFYIVDETLELEIQKEDGEIWEVEIEKDEYEDLGIEFENPLIDEAKSCTNKCIFCFIDQLPNGLRDTLYFKDDDSRLSFLTGNYVTLTNVSYDDIDRIVKYRMTPINVSVHTTNPDLRVFMLKNKFAGDISQKIRRLVDGGITVNCQIVLCRGVNDGEELNRTISDLTSLYPGVNSISIVPVGITFHREGLDSLAPFDAKTSIEAIEQTEKWQKKLLEEHNSRIVYMADEFYIMAGNEIPCYNEYEDFPQIENGVGLIALLKHEFCEVIEDVSYVDRDEKVISIATGVSAYRYIRELADAIEKKFGSLKINVYEIKNNFFGENVTVTGLLTGKDLVSQLKGKNLGEELLICRCMLKSGEELFLDDYTVPKLQEDLGMKVRIVENSGRSFIESVLGI